MITLGTNSPNESGATLQQPAKNKSNLANDFDKLCNVTPLKFTSDKPAPKARALTSDNSMHSPSHTNNNSRLDTITPVNTIDVKLEKAIVKEVTQFYDKHDLYPKSSKNRVNLQIRVVVADALKTTKRLFLHKLRNHQIGLKGSFNYAPSAIAKAKTVSSRDLLMRSSPSTNIPEVPTDFDSDSMQVQTLYTASKAERIQGHYQPIQHDMLTNFAWIYAGITNGQLNKSGDAKPINLVFYNPQSSVLDPQATDTLNHQFVFRDNDVDLGLSALGYELAFLQAAGFTVGPKKMDMSTDLTKILLNPPQGKIPSFEKIMLKAANGFLQRDFKHPKNLAKDVNNFVNHKINDPTGWGSIFN